MLTKYTYLKVEFLLCACVTFCATQLPVDTSQGATFEQVDLAMESYFEGLCVPTVSVVNPQWGVSPRISCLILCQRNPNCTFFTSTGSECKMWWFKLDEGYHLGNFSPPLKSSYWPKVQVPPPPTDVALGKPATSGSIFWIFQWGDMLTYGSKCFPKKTDCTSTAKSPNNWIRVDLEREWRVTRIVLTGPAAEARPYFTDIIIRAGQYGNRSDPIVGKTPSVEPSQDNEVFEYPVPAGVPPFRYIHLQNEEIGKEVCLCKVQAFL